MKILIAGASGMIGSVVSSHLTGQGYEVSHLVRREPSGGEVRWDPDAGEIDASGMEGFDGVVNVASMPWPFRWSAKAKQQLYANRMHTNSLLGRTLADCQCKPAVLICASGMGIYPSSGDQILTEDSPVGDDFIAHLQCDGEAATAPASLAGIRVVHMRIPGVMGGPNLLRNMGRLGNGQQWTSWVALHELPFMIEYLLATDTLTGPVNTVSPEPVRNADFVATLSRVLGRKPGLPMPVFLLRLMVGEMAEALILASRRMIPAKLLAAGYPFHFPELEDAIRHELEIAQ